MRWSIDMRTGASMMRQRAASVHGTSVRDPAYPQKRIVLWMSGWNGSHGPGSSIVGPGVALGPEVAVGMDVALGLLLGALDG